MQNIKKLTILSLLVAIEIILTRFLSIQTPILRIGFGFLPIAIAGILFGPFYAGIASCLSDILGMMIFPKGSYFPGFTFTAFVRGFMYGLILYKGQINLKKISLAAIVNVILCDLILNTIWIKMLTGNAYHTFLVARIIKSGFMIPIQAFLIWSFWVATGKRIFSLVRTNNISY